MADEIPKSILAQHPELAAVGDAIARWRGGQQVTATCMRCGSTLVVEQVEEVGVLVVRCPNGDTFFRSRGTPP
jgi:hypothetical protein